MALPPEPAPHAHDAHDAPDAPDEVAPTARKAAFGRAFLAVAWSFLGIRRSADLERDARQLNPIHVIVAALVGVAVFVLALVALVRWVTQSGVAR